MYSVYFVAYLWQPLSSQVPTNSSPRFTRPSQSTWGITRGDTITSHTRSTPCTGECLKRTQLIVHWTYSLNKEMRQGEFNAPLMHQQDLQFIMLVYTCSINAKQKRAWTLGHWSLFLILFHTYVALLWHDLIRLALRDFLTGEKNGKTLYLQVNGTKQNLETAPSRVIW